MLNAEAAAAGLTVSPNPSGEGTIHIATLSQARWLTDSLTTLVPFAYGRERLQYIFTRMWAPFASLSYIVVIVVSFAVIALR